MNGFTAYLSSFVSLLIAILCCTHVVTVVSVSLYLSVSPPPSLSIYITYAYIRIYTYVIYIYYIYISQFSDQEENLFFAIPDVYRILHTGNLLLL